jgi:hypothetical protein
MAAMRIDRLEHLVLTVADIDATVDWQEAARGHVRRVGGRPERGRPLPADERATLALRERIDGRVGQ